MDLDPMVPVVEVTVARPLDLPQRWVPFMEEAVLAAPGIITQSKPQVVMAAGFVPALYPQQAGS